MNLSMVSIMVLIIFVFEYYFLRRYGLDFTQVSNVKKAVGVKLAASIVCILNAIGLFRYLFTSFGIFISCAAYLTIGIMGIIECLAAKEALSHSRQNTDFYVRKTSNFKFVICWSADCSIINLINKGSDDDRLIDICMSFSMLICLIIGIIAILEYSTVNKAIIYDGQYGEDYIKKISRFKLKKLIAFIVNFIVCFIPIFVYDSSDTYVVISIMCGLCGYVGICAVWGGCK